jgi:hypothetical protein
MDGPTDNVNTINDDSGALSDLRLTCKGFTLGGIGRPGAVVYVLDHDNREIGEGLVGENGNFDVALFYPLTSVSQVTALQRDPDAAAPGKAVVTGEAEIREIKIVYAIEEGEPKEYMIGFADERVVLRDENNTRIAQTIPGADGAFKGYIDPPRFVRAENLTATSGSFTVTTLAPDFVYPEQVKDLEVRNDWSGLSGHGVSGMTIEVRNANNELIGSAPVTPLGEFNLHFDIAPVPGETLNVFEHSPLDRFSEPVPLLVPDVAKPDEPTGLKVDRTGTHVTGDSMPGALVKVYLNDTVIGSATVDDDGHFTAPISPPQIRGETLHVTQTGENGIESDPGAVVAWDLTEPAAPAALAVNRTGTEVTGKGTPGHTIKVYHDGREIGSATVKEDGTFSAPVSPPQIKGETLTVTQTSRFDIESKPGTVKAPDLTKPAPPQVDPMTSTGNHVTGHAVAGNKITVFGDGDVVLGTAEVKDDSTFDVTITPAQTQGQQLRVIQTSRIGIDSDPATIRAQDLAPPAPTNLHIDDKTGRTLTGNGIAGNTIKVFDKNLRLVGQGTVTGSNTFSITLNSAYTHGEVLTARQYSLTQKESAPASVEAPFVNISFGVDISGYVTGHDYTRTTFLTDTNGNGKLDLVSVEASTDLNKPGKISVFLGNGHGKFATTPTFVTDNVPTPMTGFDGWRSTFFADVTGDGNVDLVFALYNIAYSENYGGSSIYVFKGRGDGTFEKQPVKTMVAGNQWGGGDGTSNTYHQTFLVDLDGKGKMGIASITDAGAMKVYLSNGDGSFRTTPVTSTIVSPVAGLSGTYAGSDQYRSSFMTDTDQDGKADYVFAFYNAGDGNSYVMTWKGDGSGRFAKSPSVSTKPGYVWAGDSANNNAFLVRTSDAYPDLVIVESSGMTGYTQHGIHVYRRLEDNQFSRVSTDTTGLGGGTYTGWDANRSIFMADVNGDGRAELVTVIYNGSKTHINVYASQSGRRYSTSPNS